MKLHQLMGVDPASRVVALVGGGGKTTSLYALAREARDGGRRSVLLTTTHIGRPKERDVRVFDTLDQEGMEQAWEQGQVVAVGRYLPDGRLGQPEQAVWDYVFQRGQALYIEADGSRGLPLKYPADWEPVLPPETDQVLLLCGLSALDEPFDTYCHRAALARQRLGIDQHLIDEALMARVLAAGYARFSPRAVINQADGPLLISRGQRLGQELARLGIEKCSVLSLHQLTGQN